MNWITTFVFLLFSILVYSQESEDYYNPDYENSGNNSLKTPLKERTSTKIDMGGQFTSVSDNSTMFSTYIAPSMSFRLHPAFNIKAGVFFENNYYSNTLILNSDQTFSEQSGQFMNAGFYAQAEFIRNERLKITGTILYSMNNFNQNFNTLYYSPGYFTFSLRGDYQITKGLNFGFELRTTERGANPLYNHGSIPSSYNRNSRLYYSGW